MPADGSIIIDTRIDSKSAKADLQAIKAAAQATARQITGLDKQIASATNKRSKLADDLKQAQAAADGTARSLDEVNARLDAARRKTAADLQAEYPHLSAGEINRAAAGMFEQSHAADIKQVDKLSAEYTKQAAAVEKLTQEYQQQTAAAERLEQQKQGLVSQLGREQQAVEQATRAYDKAQKKNGSKNSAAKGTDLATRTDKASKAMRRFGSRMREIVSGALLFNIISSGLSSIVRWTGNALMSTDVFSAALRNLQGAASVAAAPLIEALGSALAYVINLLARGISYLAQFIAMLTGKSLSAMKSSAKAMNGYGQAAGNAAKETKEATRSLAGFDEIARLDAPQDAASSSGGGGAAGPNYDFVDGTGAGFTNLLAAMQNFWQRFQTLLAPSIAAWDSAWQQIQASVVAVLPQIQTAVSSLWINALSPLLSYMGTTFAPGVINAFSTAFAPIAGDLISAYIIDLGARIEWMCGLIESGMTNIVRPALDLVLHIWQDLMGGIESGWAQYGQPIIDLMLTAAQNIRDTISNLYYTIIEPIIQNAIRVLGDLWDQHLNPLWNDIVSAFLAIGQAALTLWNNALAPVINWLISTFGPAFSQIFNAVVGVVSTAVGFIADLLGTMVSVVRDAANFLVAIFNGDWSRAWDIAANCVSNVWTRITNMLRSAINGIIGFINSLINGVVSGINGMIGALNSVSFNVPRWLGGGHIGFNIGYISAPQIPYLAQGAVIPPNREFLAVLGDQSSGTNVEAPLSTIQQAVAAVMQDNLDGELSALEAIRSTLLDILEAVYGVDISGSAVSAVNRYTMRNAIITGRA